MSDSGTKSGPPTTGVAGSLDLSLAKLQKATEGRTATSASELLERFPARHVVALDRDITQGIAASALAEELERILKDGGLA